MYHRLFLFCFLAIGSVHAEVKLATVFSDHAILQRDHALPIWGTAKPGETVTVTFGGQTQKTTASADGSWRVTLPSLPASAESRTLTAQGENRVELQDILVGDVWLASGQSNMGSPMSSGASAAELPQANDPALRFFSVTKATAPEPQPDLKGKWEVTTPVTAKNFSAVAYYFAKELRETQKIPIGILHSSWGGTPIQTWMSLESLRRDPPVAKTVADWDQAYAQHLAVKDKPELMQAYRADMKDWETTVGPQLKAAISAHNELMAAARAAGQPTTPGPQPTRPEPVMPDPTALPAPSKRPSTPTVSYNAVIAPLAPYALKGILWYQGEADGSHGAEYRTLFPRLIEGWRKAWNQDDLPFIFVQLPSCYPDPKPVADSGWPFLREAQSLALQIPHTAMVVTLDIGDPNNVHPDDKIFVGHRVALLGRKLAYGEKLVASGPLYHDYAVEGDKIRVRFSEAEDGLVIGLAPWRPVGVEPLPTDRLAGFYIAGPDKQWVEADARIDGASVVVSSSKITQPTAVRYGWAQSPKVNLYNQAGLPAAPFRTDDWPK